MAQCNPSFLFGFTVLWIIFGSCNAFPSGAPASACETMLPGHTGVQPQKDPAPYEFLVSTPSFLNGQPINVQILGSAYRGLLLEARSFGSTAALGLWQAPPNDTKFLQCSGNPQGAITHSNTNIKTRQTTYTWLPPNSDCPPVITFIATVAQSHDIYWTNMRSKVIWRSCCGRRRSVRTHQHGLPGSLTEPKKIFKPKRKAIAFNMAGHKNASVECTWPDPVDPKATCGAEIPTQATSMTAALSSLLLILLGYI